MTSFSDIKAALVAIGNDMKNALAVSGEGEALPVPTAPIYEYREIWAEENGAISSGAEWSYGNGAVGYIGLPHDGKAGWEVISIYFNADVYTVGTTGSVDFMLYKTASGAEENVITSIDIAGIVAARAAKHVDISPPVPIEAVVAPLGFYTRSVIGSATRVQVGVRMRRQIGEYVTAAPTPSKVPSNAVVTDGWVIDTL